MEIRHGSDAKKEGTRERKTAAQSHRTNWAKLDSQCQPPVPWVLATQVVHGPEGEGHGLARLCEVGMWPGAWPVLT